MSRWINIEVYYNGLNEPRSRGVGLSLHLQAGGSTGWSARRQNLRIERLTMFKIKHVGLGRPPMGRLAVWGKWAKPKRTKLMV